LSKLQEALVLTKESFVSNTKEQLNQEKSNIFFYINLIPLILIQKVVEHFPLPCGIFSRILGHFLAKLFDFLFANFSKTPFYTKKIKNDNSSLVLRRQKKIGFFALIPNFPKNIGDFSSSENRPKNPGFFDV